MTIDIGLAVPTAADADLASLPMAAIPATPPWLDLVERVHASGPSAAPMAADAALLALATLALGLPPRAGVALAALALLGLIAGRHYVTRSTLETQGIAWYPPRVAASCAVATALVAAVAGPGVTGWRVGGAGLAGFCALVGVRAVTWLVLSTTRRQGLGLRPTAVLGCGPRAELVVSKLNDFPEAGLAPTMRLNPAWGEGDSGIWASDEAGLAMRSSDIRQIIVVPDGNPEPELCDYVDEVTGVDVALVPPLAELFLIPRGRTFQVGGLPLLPVGRVGRPQHRHPAKRAFDLVGSLLALVVLSPVLALSALAIRVTSEGPVIYRQRRVGRAGQPFEIWKFRTMSVGAERAVVDLRHRNAADGLLFKIEHDPRVTPVGRILRRLSVDELPQLVNVLKGQMSLVGPRPLAVDPESFAPAERGRHAIAPGITGYWQVNGGNALTYQEMIKLDLAYIHGWTLWLDVLLLARTVPALVRRRGPW
jgi:exopolysaccharide biosynthesis polyprenyl glycosylphosphotransferase